MEFPPSYRTNVETGTFISFTMTKRIPNILLSIIHNNHKRFSMILSLPR